MSAFVILFKLFRACRMTLEHGNLHHDEFLQAMKKDVYVGLSAIFKLSCLDGNLRQNQNLDLCLSQ